MVRSNSSTSFIKGNNSFIIKELYINIEVLIFCWCRKCCINHWIFCLVFFKFKFISFHENSFWFVFLNSKRYFLFFFTKYIFFFNIKTIILLPKLSPLDRLCYFNVKSEFTIKCCTRNSMLSDTWHMPQVIHCLSGEIEL